MIMANRVQQPNSQVNTKDWKYCLWNHQV